MDFNLKDTVLTIYLKGNVDTTNASVVEQEIDEILSKNAHESLVLDLEELNYISSAGLRVILRLKKKNNALKLINCSNEVYDVFEMTGFSEMMDISKAYRKLSVEGCEIIGEGSNGVVYRLNEDTIIKVYKNSDALDDIQREKQLAKKALVLGINTAIVYDVVKVGDKYGSVFELLAAKSLTKHINENKADKDKYIKVFADMLLEIHQTKVEDGTLPKIKETAITWVEYLKQHLPVETYEKLYKLVSEVEDRETMIHGDYHTNNVHYDNKEAIIIDMDTLSVGHPVFEFASIYLAYQGYGIVDHSKIENFMKLNFETATYIWNKLVDLYFVDKDETYKQAVKQKAMIIGYIRCLRRTIKREPDNKALIDYSRNYLIENAAKVDSLNF